MDDEEPNLVSWQAVTVDANVRCPHCRKKLTSLAARDCGLCLGTGVINDTVAAAYRLGGLSAVKDYMRGDS